MKTSIRPLGDITDDLEPLLQEMVTSHRMQIQEVTQLIFGYLSMHSPDSVPVFEEDDSKPVLYIGHWSGLK